MSTLELVQFQPGEKLFVQGERTFFFYMIKEGQVEVYKEVDEKEIHLAHVEAGQSLGEFALIDKLPRSASARAVTPVVAVQISEEAYAKLLADLPTWAQAMMEGLVSRLRKANEIIRTSEELDEQTVTNFNITEFDFGTDTEIVFDGDLADIGNKKRRAS